jgi:hypothetical protein
LLGIPQVTLPSGPVMTTWPSGALAVTCRRAGSPPQARRLPARGPEPGEPARPVGQRAARPRAQRLTGPCERSRSLWAAGFADDRRALCPASPKVVVRQPLSRIGTHGPRPTRRTCTVSRGDPVRCIEPWNSAWEGGSHLTVEAPAIPTDSRHRRPLRPTSPQGGGGMTWRGTQTAGCDSGPAPIADPSRSPVGWERAPCSPVGHAVLGPVGHVSLFALIRSGNGNLIPWCGSSSPAGRKYH